MNTIIDESGFEIELDSTDQPNVSNQALENTSSVQKLQQPNSSEKPRSLSTFMRIFGACAVVASLSMFLIEGWADGNDLARYMKLLAQTGLITAAGIFLSFIVKEVKGARVFFGLGLASATAHFTILGALTYSIFQFDKALGDYPSMLQWQAVSLADFLPLAIGAVVLLALLARFSFSIFARPFAAKLTLTFLVLNALLLIPVREALYVSALAAIALLVAMQVVLSIIKSDALLMTREAKYALACLFLPGIIIVSRALGLYAVDELVLITLLSLIYYALRSAGQMLTQATGTQKLMSSAQYLAGLLVAGLAVSLLPSQMSSLSTLIFSLITLGVTYDQVSLQSKAKSNMPSSFITATAVVLVFANVIAAVTSSLLLVKFLSLLVLVGASAMIQFWTNTLKDLRASQLLTLGGIAIVGLSLITSLVTLLQIGAWAMIGGLGIALIVIASLYERYGLNMKLRLPQQAVE